MNEIERRRLRWIYACHLVLGALMIAWRMLESTPGTASATGAVFSASRAGRVLALVSIVAAVVALVSVAILSIRAWRHWQVIVLFVALAASLALRRSVDAFDVVYLMLVAIFAALWFDRGRASESRS